MNETIRTSAGVVDNRSKVELYLELTKPRISVMVLMTVLVAALVSGGLNTNLLIVINAMVGTFLIAASGSALNQYVERWSDFYMPRTQRRPLPAQRLAAGEVAVFGAITFGSGLVYLATTVNTLSAVLGFATWTIYVWVYTPLKRYTWTNTIVGAVAGALPILIGAAAVGAFLNTAAWGFFGVLLLWQFPHFMAIAWKYREDYKSGGLKMLTVSDPTGKLAGLLAVVTAIALVPVSLIAIFALSQYSILLSIPALLIGCIYVVRSIKFYRQPNDATAKQLLRNSLIVLPVYMLILVASTVF